ncbi:MAG: hypothetical protein K8S54_12445 [Spirochaetia bacterium]|nr:hypothetical protein [Spirochaetia bacterium]
MAILASALLHDGKFRKVFGDIWLESIHKSSIQAIKLFQKRKELRSDVDPSILTRMVASLSLSQVMLRILFPESQPSTELEVSQYVSILTNGVL